MIKYLLLFVISLIFLSGCSSPDNPKMDPVTSNEAPTGSGKSVQSVVNPQSPETIASSPDTSANPEKKERQEIEYPTPTPLDINQSATDPDQASTKNTCSLAGGEEVDSGWAGKDSGSNYCNQCMCMEGKLACTKMACPVLEVGNNEKSNPVTTTNSSYPITSLICTDSSGPDCSKLRLGDNFLSTTNPAKGHLFSCSGKNPDAPGANASKITWIDLISNTWDFFKKPWLPEGSFNPGNGEYSETTSENKRNITTNNLPLDGKIGDWPMTNYHELTAIDRNPGIPKAEIINFEYPLSPIEQVKPSCVSLGAIGIAKNGVVIYSAVDARGEDAVAREIVDIFGGHPAQSSYHYHFVPERLDDTFLEDGHSGVVGYINDGFPIHGYKGVGGVEVNNDALDICHGHNHDDIGYHYHATIEYPYTIGCYIGTPSSIHGAQSGMDQSRERPPRRNR